LAVGATNAEELAKGYRAISNPNGISAAIDWIPSSCSQGCGPMGTCIALDQCHCAPQFVGTSCQCSGQFFCSGNGVCKDGNGTCLCNNNYYGSNCSVFCFANSTCSGFGICSQNGNCVCNPGWSGKSCSTPPHSSLTTRTVFQSDYIVQGKNLKFHWWFHVPLQSQRIDVVNGSNTTSFYFRYDKNLLFKVTQDGGSTPFCVSSSLGFKTLKPFPALATPAYQGYFDCVPLGRTGNNCEKWYSTSIDMVPLSDGNFPLVDPPKVIYSDIDIPATNQIQVPVYLNAGAPIQFNTFNESPFDTTVFTPPAFC